MRGVPHLRRFVQGGLWLVPLVSLFAWNARLAGSLIAPLAPRLFTARSVALAGDGDRITYPRLGIVAPLERYPGALPWVASDWEQLQPALHQGVIITSLATDGTPIPDGQPTLGVPGTTHFITGHSSDRFPHAYSAVFAALGQVRIGDSFSLETGGLAYQYRVVAKDVRSPGTVATLAQERADAPLMGVESERVYLVTCWPLLTDWSRLVVTAVRE